MPFPFESIMNDTGSTTTKSITSSTKSISIDYEINDSVANHSPFKSSRRPKSSHSHSHSSSSNNNGDFKLSMADHSSTGSTQSTQSKDNDDTQINDFHQDSTYNIHHILCELHYLYLFVSAAYYQCLPLKIKT